MGKLRERGGHIMDEKQKINKKDGKRYETDHSYFLTDAPNDNIIMDEDMAKNVNQAEQKD